MEGICEYCNKKLIRFKSTLDWSNRRLHKSCWKKKQEDMSLAFIIEHFDKCMKETP